MIRNDECLSLGQFRNQMENNIVIKVRRCHDYELHPYSSFRVFTTTHTD